MNNKEINTLMELDLYMNIINNLKIPAWPGDNKIKEYIREIMEELYCSGDLEYYIINMDFNLEDMINKIINVFLNDPVYNESESLYNFIEYSFGNNYSINVLYDLNELYDLVNNKVHYKTRLGYEGAYYYFNKFNININMDSFIIIDHNKKYIKSIDLLSAEEIDSILDLFINEFIESAEDHEIFNIIEQLKEVGDPYTIIINNPGEISPDMLMDLKSYNKNDPFIYIHNSYTYKSRSLKEGEIINYLDMDLLKDMILNEDLSNLYY